MAENTDPNLDPDADNNISAEEKNFTQADLDKIIAKRLAAAEKSWRTSAEEEQKKATMTEVEKLKVEKEEALTNASNILKNANEKLFRADFKSLANTLGIIDSEVAFMLIDRTDLQDDEGNVDIQALQKSLETLITQKPYLKGQVQNPIPNLPGNPPFKNTGTLTKEQLKTMKPEAIAKLDFALVAAALKN